MQSSDSTQQRRVDWPIIAFFALAYALAWGVIGLMGLIGRGTGVDALTLMSRGEILQLEGLALPLPDGVIYLLTRVADFAFTISGLIVIASTQGRAGLRALWQRLTRFRFGATWWLAALIPLGLFALATLVAALTADGPFPVDLSGRTWQRVFLALDGGLLVTLFLRGAFGEEFGLRGFALPHLQERMAPFRASAIIGILWALWHLPVLLGRDAVSIIAFLLVAFSLSFVFTWLFNGSGGSLIPGLIFHAIQNSEEMFEAVFPALTGTDWELVSTVGLLIVGIVTAIVIGRQARSPESVAA